MSEKKQSKPEAAPPAAEKEEAAAEGDEAADNQGRPETIEGQFYMCYSFVYTRVCTTFSSSRVGLAIEHFALFSVCMRMQCLFVPLLL